MQNTTGTRLSVIVPTLNEAGAIAACLADLAPLRAAGHEIIVCDGGSADATLALAAPLATRVLTAPRGRARQMNAAAAQACGDWLWFVHADTRLPEAALRYLTRIVPACGADWGRFDVRLAGRRPMLRLIARLMNARSWATGIATGDQAIFVRRALFERVGGFPDQPLMEDVALSRRLKRHARPLCPRVYVVTSSRRWERYGLWRTVWLMWRLRLRYALGADPARLARDYPHGD